MTELLLFFFIFLSSVIFIFRMKYALWLFLSLEYMQYDAFFVTIRFNTTFFTNHDDREELEHENYWTYM